MSVKPELDFDTVIVGLQQLINNVSVLAINGTLNLIPSRVRWHVSVGKT